MGVLSAPNQRLHAVANHTANAGAPSGKPFLILPDGDRVDISHPQQKEGPYEVRVNGRQIISYTISGDTQLALELSSVGTRFHGATTSVPKYPLIALSAPQSLTVVDCWIAVYALFEQYYTQEHIPITLDTLANTDETRTYLLTSGLGRVAPSPPANAPPALFLSRAAFWQGAGTTGFHSRSSWLMNPLPPPAPVPAYTRSERVIATHPARPSKPRGGEVLYRRWCGAIGDMFDITYFDLNGVHDGSTAAKGAPDAGEAGDKTPSRHLAAFHKWHNDERVDKAWGERGELVKHRKYIEEQLADPHALPCMLSWNGELMGYAELVYVKEDHVAQHYPAGTFPGEWERGFHVLVGESKFLGGGRGECYAFYSSYPCELISIPRRDLGWGSMSLLVPR